MPERPTAFQDSRTAGHLRLITSPLQNSEMLTPVLMMQDSDTFSQRDRKTSVKKCDGEAAVRYSPFAIRFWLSALSYQL
jgi:hypothetical protein